MAGDHVEVDIDINVENNSNIELTEITNNVVHLHQAVQREEKQENRWEKSLKRIGKAAGDAARAVAKVAASVSAVAAATGPAVSGLLAAGKAVATFGTKLADLTPLVAFLPSLIGALKLVTATAKLMGPGFAKAFQPILANFRDAKGEASAFTKRLQDIAGIGLKPLTAEFNRLNIPAIQKGMEGVAYQLNGIVYHTLRWLNTTAGQSLISKITTGTSKAMEALSPHVLRLVYAFGALAEKAGDKAIVGLGNTIGRILDKISAWAETHDLDDINNALKDLTGYGVKLRQVFGVVREIGRWLAENEGAVKKFSDVAAGAAVALGIATGNVPAVVAGAVSLIINHWNQLKAPFGEAIGWVKNVIDAWERDAGRIKIAASIMKAVDGFKKSFGEAIDNIGPRWALFVREIKSAWESWAPLIKIWWDSAGKKTFEAIGTALGLFLTNMVLVAAGAAIATKAIAEAFKWMVMIVLDTLGGIINGAAKAFSWVPGLGPELSAAALAFNAFRDKVNNALNGIDPIKTIRINASVYVTSGNTAAGGVDQRTGNARNSGLSGLTSWQRVAAAFAGEQSGTSRTGGPTPVTASVQNTVLLDGRPFRDYTDRVVFESERRTAWNAKNRRR